MPTNSLLGLTRLILLAGLSLAGPVLADTEYTDTVVLKNGNTITGNVKGLAQGQLSLDTDAMGTVLIEWDKIAEITSETGMQVETITSDRYFGVLEKPTQNGEIVVNTTTGKKVIPSNNIVHFTPINVSPWKRIQGSLSTGLSYTKSSNVTQYNIHLAALYRSRQHQVAVKYDSIVTRQDSGTTGQIDSGISYKGFRQNGWYGVGFLSFQRNEDLGIDGRGLLGAGLGRNMWETSRSILSLSAGLDVNAEDTTDGSQDSLELFGTLEYLLYKFQGSTTNLAFSTTIFPSLTDSRRVRTQVSTKLRQELFDNFFWGLTFYATSDNQPPLGALSKNDYGLITSVGWSFGP
jgi:hypothetical protein